MTTRATVSTERWIVLDAQDTLRLVAEQIDNALWVTCEVGRFNEASQFRPRVGFMFRPHALRDVARAFSATAGELGQR